MKPKKLTAEEMAAAGRVSNSFGLMSVEELVRRLLSHIAAVEAERDEAVGLLSAECGAHGIGEFTRSPNGTGCWRLVDGGPRRVCYEDACPICRKVLGGGE